MSAYTPRDLTTVNENQGATQMSVREEEIPVPRRVVVEASAESHRADSNWRRVAGLDPLPTAVSCDTIIPGSTQVVVEGVLGGMPVATPV